MVLAAAAVLREATSSYTNPTCTDLELDLGRRNWKPGAKRLCHGTVDSPLKPLALAESMRAWVASYPFRIHSGFFSKHPD
jgi:hypothetical protein